ncbi:DUF4252 domain-containing protein [Cytophaga sp. FL35]|uniref:DUF4252 domain-containing protein n=1 Tax=Cytophaga sp. FL35 TaxID=1904456 RepID=UPI001653959F|nr:DUF4252 domain-containing protein [Cytophaga sp. FL35]MBC6998649.1 DUF4252 domain-containing protein [Cytophaga sp. FL35]
MKLKNIITGLLAILLLAACSSTQSLQEYIVENSENPNFLSIDLPASLLNLDEANISAEEKKSLDAVRKLNVLAFKKDDSNEAEFQLEKTKVRAVLKGDKFTELMKINTAYGKASIKYLGEEDAIDEVVIYGDNEEKGFLLVRVLGDDMNPAKMMSFVQLLQKSDLKRDGLEQLGSFLKE